jgi:hypothetical protein
MIMTLPSRLIILQLLQIFFTDGLTFISISSLEILLFKYIQINLIYQADNNLLFFPENNSAS